MGSTWQDRRIQRKHAQPPAVPRHRSGKDTKRWCKGVQGREHCYRYVQWRQAYGWNDGINNQVVSIEECAGCGKHRDAIWPRYVGHLRCYGPGH